MPLPLSSPRPWPPAAHAGVARDLTIADAWWSGDPDRLATVYTDRSTAGSGPRRRRSFWSKRPADTVRRTEGRIHVPAASDIAGVSADLLFGDGFTLRTDDDTASGRLGELFGDDSSVATLIEAADVASGLGGVYLRPVWDPAIAAQPMLTVVHADRAVPEWTWTGDRLAAVTFWRTIPTDRQGTIYRHLERHEPGAIYHGLYAGTDKQLGRRVPLDELPETAALAASVDPDGKIALPAQLATTVLPAYVPNALPNRKHRGQRVGRPDTAGVEDLMDALDEAMTSWMRDIRLAKARIIVPDEFLDRRGRGQGATFDPDQEVFSPLEMDPGHAEKAGITLNQFEIRTEAHAGTCASLFERIVTSAGYSPQTFGMQGTGAEQTATEVHAREDRSVRATKGKRRYWGPAICQVAESMLALDQALFGGPAGPIRPSIEWPDLEETSIADLASTVEMINRAQAASIATKVGLLHPDWDDTEVADEVARIAAEQGLAPDPTGGLP